MLHRGLETRVIIKTWRKKWALYERHYIFCTKENLTKKKLAKRENWCRKKKLLLRNQSFCTYDLFTRLILRLLISLILRLLTTLISRMLTKVFEIFQSVHFDFWSTISLYFDAKFDAWTDLSLNMQTREAVLDIIDTVLDNLILVAAWATISWRKGRYNILTFRQRQRATWYLQCYRD